MSSVKTIADIPDFPPPAYHDVAGNHSNDDFLDNICRSDSTDNIQDWSEWVDFEKLYFHIVKYNSISIFRVIAGYPWCFSKLLDKVIADDLPLFFQILHRKNLIKDDVAKGIYLQNKPRILKYILENYRHPETYFKLFKEVNLATFEVMYEFHKNHLPATWIQETPICIIHTYRKEVLVKLFQRMPEFFGRVQATQISDLKFLQLFSNYVDMKTYSYKFIYLFEHPTEIIDWWAERKVKFQYHGFDLESEMNCYRLHSCVLDHIIKKFPLFLGHFQKQVNLYIGSRLFSNPDDVERTIVSLALNRIEILPQTVCIMSLHYCTSASAETVKNLIEKFHFDLSFSVADSRPMGPSLSLFKCKHWLNHPHVRLQGVKKFFQSLTEYELEEYSLETLRWMASKASEPCEEVLLSLEKRKSTCSLM